MKLSKNGKIDLGGEVFGIIHNGTKDLFYYDLNVNKNEADLALMIPDLVQCAKDALILSKCEEVGELQMKMSIEGVIRKAEKLLKNTREL